MSQNRKKASGGKQGRVRVETLRQEAELKKGDAKGISGGGGAGGGVVLRGGTLEEMARKTTTK